MNWYMLLCSADIFGLNGQSRLRRSVSLCIYLSTDLYMSIYRSICQSIYLYLCPSLSLSFYLLCFCLSISYCHDYHLKIRRLCNSKQRLYSQKDDFFFYLSIYLSIYLTFYLTTIHSQLMRFSLWTETLSLDKNNIG